MQLKLLALLGAIVPITSAQNNTVAQNYTITITDNLVEIIHLFPRCSLPYLSDLIYLQRCRVKEFDCICNRVIDITDNLKHCMHGGCNGTHNDVRARMWDFCHRLEENPPAAEMEAARILMRKRVRDQFDWLDRPIGEGRTVAEPDITVMGVAVAAAAALMI
ncbi:hypothetical protein F4813DRAFT_389417 [Daldinia decipiens]|uniref:uncharacterized protein n=1 Tax=Daldinia decipiens TaxID=326647 RepID=UPI0020C4ACCD|nr:uncharacterized protein F4813DRAFT_389417 [Daldinia decipiens]KAI1657680.1 hypothetical protein F4813DRAFT_389417 [Daldinia decipiens]